MIKMKIDSVDRNNRNTPILSKEKIEKFARDVLKDYKPHLLDAPGAVRYQHFLENYCELTLLFRDIYYDDPDSPIFGMIIFRGCTVEMFDYENERVKHEIFRPNTAIIDNYLLEPGKERLANSAGCHEGGHCLMHSGVTFKPGEILCRRENIEGAVMRSIHGMNTEWLEFQAYYFTSCLTMPKDTLLPLVYDFLRKHDVWKSCIKLGLNEDLNILGKDLLPEYVAETYGVTKRAAFNRLKGIGFIEI